MKTLSPSNLLTTISTNSENPAFNDPVDEDIAVVDLSKVLKAKRTITTGRMLMKL
jgi:hypothetical protein